MRAVVVSVLMLAVAMFGAQADAAELPGEADRAAIKGLIQAQIAAFGRDDAAGAWAAASPEIQERFRTPEFFLEVVRSKYPAIYRAKSISFQALRDEAGLIRQDVSIVGPDGAVLIVTYAMQRQRDGSWRINGVLIHENEEIAI